MCTEGAATSHVRIAGHSRRQLLANDAAPAPGAALSGTARSWRGIVPFTHLAREGRMAVTIGRRELLASFGGAAAAWPLAARAQQPGMPVVGFLRSTSANASIDLVAALRRGLAEAGYTEGQNIAIEYRWAEGHNDRLPALVADLVSRQCALIVAGGDAAAHAAKTATTTVPIVFATGEDPVKVGLVSRLNRPGGNITGISFYNSADLESKQLELLREVVPKAAVVGVLVNPTMAAVQSQESEAQVAARALGLQLFVVNAGSDRDFDTAFTTLVEHRIEALLIVGNAL